MFRDIDLSRDLLSCFKETKQAREEITGFELGVSVITASLWPTYAVFAVNIPQEVNQWSVYNWYFFIFKTFYSLLLLSLA